MEKKIDKMSRTIQRQERVISEMTCFIHDTLDHIFLKASQKQEKVVTVLNTIGSGPKDKDDPFELYQGYLTFIKPVDFENENQKLEERVKMLEQMLRDSEDKTSAI